MNKHDHPTAPARGFTLIELMVVVALIGALVMLSGPSFKRFIDTQRLRSVNSALITDLQFARSEAASRNMRTLRIKFDPAGASMSCYTIFIGDASACDCTRTPGVDVCSGTTQTEIRTVQIPRSTGIALSLPAYTTSQSIQFDPATGRLLVFLDDTYVLPTVPFQISVSNPAIGGFLDSVEATGRPSSCSPSGSLSGVTPCAP